MPTLILMSFRRSAERLAGIYLKGHLYHLAPLLLQRLLGELGQHERGLVHLAAVVLEQLVLLLLAELPERLLHIAAGVLAAHHEADLAGRVGRDRRPPVLRDREDGL